MANGKILIIDDEPTIIESLEMYLSEKGYEISKALNGKEGLLKHLTFKPDIIILDIRLPDINGFDILKELKNRGEESRTIIITAFHDMENTIKAVKLGAFEYLPKPIDVDELELTIKKIINHLHISQSSKTLPLNYSQDYEKDKIVGKSTIMKEIFKIIGKISETKTSVLIEGETGTGKELVAKAIHSHSLTKNEPFIAINCSAIVENLFESELFGHEKGAFTSAFSTKKGKLELAGNGTIFLDEIGEIPLELQAKILRFLQEKEFTRVGSEKTLRSNARVIAATNKDLKKMVLQGDFREDLFYRLSVVTIKVPPLRERKSDIPFIVEYLIKKINLQLHTNIKKITRGALNKMLAYNWPGNVRELENILTQAAILSHGEEITEDLVPILITNNEKPDRKHRLPPPLSLGEIEREHIINVLEYVQWNYGNACKFLGISRPTLRKKLIALAITPPLYKTQIHKK